jgi:hypothetical protein
VWEAEMHGLHDPAEAMRIAEALKETEVAQHVLYIFTFATGWIASLVTFVWKTVRNEPAEAALMIAGLMLMALGAIMPREASQDWISTTSLSVSRAKFYNRGDMRSLLLGSGAFICLLSVAQYLFHHS